MNRVLAVFISLVSFCFCCYTLVQFMMFLSSHSPLKYYRTYVEDQRWKHEPTWILVIKNFFLLGIFMFQHTLQAQKSVKNYLFIKGYDVIERSFYNCGSCIALQVMMHFWQPVPQWTVWEISTSKNILMWWLFFVVHFLSWLSIYSGCVVMDVTELLGVKQVYHYIQNWPEPLDRKSEGLIRFYSHMRHPGFTAFVVIFFVHPVMQIDRLFLAFALTVYMLLRFRVDECDYSYQLRMLQRKERDLNFSH